MKRLFIPIFMLLPLTMQAQTVLTPEEQLEQAQKQLEAAKKALEEAKLKAKQANEAKKAAQAKEVEAKAKEMQAQAERMKAEAERINAEAAKLTQESEELKPVVVKEPTVPNNTINSNNGWAVPTAVPEKKAENAPTLVNGVALKQDPKYLAGAITTDERGKVDFELVTDASGKTANQIYDIVYQYMSQLTQGEQNIASRVALVNPSEHIIANTMDEWLVFNASFISLDRTEFKYNLIATIKDNYLKLNLCRINYTYEEGRNTGFKLPAEEVITDKVALNKKKNDFAKVFGKFRRLTIDRKDQIFTDLSQLVKQ